ncbi:DUF2383 domain-containing protein [Jannaschia aquimarina]|uniref:DUF2383 domain-containing protein n=1 Tax=Jannaschia aquimarina TaxID=935700 RepID=A0A0D1CSW7_9RHOB|nr:DUF2383 domain-containing protein [Jannaschia aquimarina]KIT17847.1 hypothetical protein jaqu_04370 [Jannaschia aquimarina]SNS90119.1 Rubrerythrin [Jannaschia aquimarina]
MQDDLPASPAQLAPNHIAATEVADVDGSRDGATEEALRDALTATLDALEGYRAMEGHVAPDLQGLIRDWREAHEGHAAELERALLRQGGVDDEGSMMGTLNSVVVTTRGMLVGIDRAALGPIAKGEQRTIDAYAKAADRVASPAVREMLNGHRTRLVHLANRTQDMADRA